MVTNEIKKCNASECNNTFGIEQRVGRPQVYCSDRCRDREKARVLRESRAKQGLCVTCGEESPAEGRRQCQTCLTKRNKRYRESAAGLI